MEVTATRSAGYYDEPNIPFPSSVVAECKFCQTKSNTPNVFYKKVKGMGILGKKFWTPWLRL